MNRERNHGLHEAADGDEPVFVSAKRRQLPTIVIEDGVETRSHLTLSRRATACRTNPSTCGMKNMKYCGRYLLLWKIYLEGLR